MRFGLTQRPTRRGAAPLAGGSEGAAGRLMGRIVAGEDIDRDSTCVGWCVRPRYGTTRAAKQGIVLKRSKEA